MSIATDSVSLNYISETGVTRAHICWAEGHVDLEAFIGAVKRDWGQNIANPMHGYMRVLPNGEVRFHASGGRGARAVTWGERP